MFIHWNITHFPLIINISIIIFKGVVLCFCGSKWTLLNSWSERKKRNDKKIDEGLTLLNSFCQNYLTSKLSNIWFAKIIKERGLGWCVPRKNKSLMQHKRCNSKFALKLIEFHGTNARNANTLSTFTEYTICRKQKWVFVVWACWCWHFVCISCFFTVKITRYQSKFTVASFILH